MLKMHQESAWHFSRTFFQLLNLSYIFENLDQKMPEKCFFFFFFWQNVMFVAFFSQNLKQKLAKLKI